MKKTLFSILVLSCFYSGLLAQAGIYDEEDISFQNKFMDAQSAKYLEKYDEQIAILEELNRNHRACHACYKELATAYLMNGDNSKAESNIKRALSIDENNDAYKKIASEIFLKTGNDQEAIAALKDLVSKERNDYLLHQKLVSVLVKTNDESLLSEIGNYESKFGINEKSTRWKLDYYSKNNDISNKILAVESLVAEYPDNTRYLNNLASLYTENNQVDKAKDTYEQILIIDPNDATANLFNVSKDIENAPKDSYLKAIMPLIENKSIGIDEKIKELIPYLENLNSDPNNPETIALKNISDKLIQLYPKEAKVFALRGDINFNTSDYKNAEKDYAKTNDLNPNNFEVWDTRMRNAIQLDDYDLLSKISTEAIDFFPLQFNPYFYNALASLKTNDESNAKNQMMEAQFMVGSNPIYEARIQLLKAKFDIVQNNNKEAKNKLNKYNTENPINEFLIYDLMFDLYKNEDLDLAKKYWELAKKMGYNSPQFLSKVND